jgi:hypothetical protein
MILNKSQLKRWIKYKTKQYIYLITKQNPNDIQILFVNNFNKYPHLYTAHAACSKDLNLIIYRTDYINNNINKNSLECLIIHEVCHLLYIKHTNEFFIEYKKWSGDDYISRYLNKEFDGNINQQYYINHVKGLPNINIE